MARKKLKEFDVRVTVRFKARSESDARGLGEGLVDHILDTFNDGGSVVEVYGPVVEPAPQH